MNIWGVIIIGWFVLNALIYIAFVGRRMTWDVTPAMGIATTLVYTGLILITVAAVSA